MLEFLLLCGLLVFVVIINRFLKTTADKHEEIQRRNKRRMINLLPFAFVFAMNIF